jgi:nitrilase
MKVAVVQMVSGVALAPTSRPRRSLLRQAAEQGAELAVLPEYFCIMGQRDTDKLAHGEAFGSGPIQQFLADTARELGLWLVAGTLPLVAPPGPEPDAPDASDAPDAPARVFNSSLVYSSAGQCVARYDKIHLFRFRHGNESYDESRVLCAGEQPVLFELASREGMSAHWLSVCCDLRFAEHTTAAARRPIAAGAQRLHYRRAPLGGAAARARALRTWLCGGGGAGVHEKPAPGGTRCWCDPGARCWRTGAGCRRVLADLGMERLRALRSQLPALSHRVL